MDFFSDLSKSSLLIFIKIKQKKKEEIKDT